MVYKWCLSWSVSRPQISCRRGEHGRFVMMLCLSLSPSLSPRVRTASVFMQADYYGGRESDVMGPEWAGEGEMLLFSSPGHRCPSWAMSALRFAAPPTLDLNFLIRVKSSIAANRDHERKVIT